MITNLTPPLISIIIPVLHLSRAINPKRFFMPRQTIQDTLADIKKNVKIPHEVIVICNGGDPKLREFIAAHPQITRYCINSQNVGVARSWNMGAQMADAPVLCYLNDDVSIGPRALESLYDQLMADPLIGEIGPSGSYWKDCAHDRYVEGSEPTSADVVLGFCFLLRATTFHELGGFDVNFSPAGCEEIDLSYRIRAAGMKCVVDPSAHIKHYHHHGVSAYRVDITYLGKTIDTLTLHERNTAYFRKKWAHVFP
jgi:GT2 family glycosyltransferase